MKPKTLGILPGCARHEHAHWHLAPCARHRDSDTVEESNFQVQLAAFAHADPAGTTYEVHRFGHWAVGWIEEVAVQPDSSVAALAAEFRTRLSHHPILDEEHLASLELDAH